MKTTILTLFPEMFDGPFRESILKHAQQKGLLEIEFVNIRDFGHGTHKVVDDTPYGGGVGMVMKVDVLDKAISSAREEGLTKKEERIVLLDARGETFNQTVAKEFSQLKHLILICGHYEGVDERVRDLVDETISIGDFILTGGEIPAMLIVDSVARLLPGVLKPDATTHESFSIQTKQGVTRDGETHGRGSLVGGHGAVKRQDPEKTLLEYPQYTTPREYNGKNVPDVLLSGNHKEIEKFRQESAKKITQKHRPDLLK
ncbi:MAG TPA: tRNA (guanosine(37)-N1)-methyltransferase TrmD [Candidatus Eisenbacteria bacterium]|nr:tRNA (guanosine(37)-N1)-methyltransferase TrmD [Candidatus Eisenbacteria bacterium]